jgi:hypothetical protein
LSIVDVAIFENLSINLKSGIVKKKSQIRDGDVWRTVEPDDVPKI